MKTGNSVLAVFFFYMAFRIPVEISNLSLAYNIPDDGGYKFLSVVLFGVCIMLGCVSLEYGRESKIKKEKNIEILDLPTSLKNSISNVDKSISVVNKSAVPEVDKNLPIIKAVENNNDNFAKISTNIDDVIGVKTKEN